MITLQYQTCGRIYLCPELTGQVVHCESGKVVQDDRDSRVVLDVVVAHGGVVGLRGQTLPPVSPVAIHSDGIEFHI